MAKRLRAEGQRAEAIHGDLRQNRRERVINAFRNRKHRIMVATDIAARGLDIPHIAHVINYDLPQCPEDYIHRIGRTARAGSEGSALCFVTAADKKKWQSIERLINPNAKPVAKSSSGPRPRPTHKSAHKRHASKDAARATPYAKKSRRKYPARRRAAPA